MSTHIESSSAQSIAVIGVGAMGGAIARAIAATGTAVQIANSRGPESLKDFVGDHADVIHATTIDEAASADIVVLTVPWSAVADTLGRAPKWNGRILIDATNAVEFLASDSSDVTDPANPLGFLGLKAYDLAGRSSSEIVAELAPDARVVKTFNHIEPPLLAEPNTDKGRGVIFLAGDDDDARTKVAELLGSLGLFAADLGPLASGSLIAFPGGSLLGLGLIKP